MMCRLMIERAEGWTFAEIGQEMGISASAVNSRIDKLEDRHGSIRAGIGRSRCGRRTVYVLTRRGRVVAGALADGNPVPTGMAPRPVKRSAIETAYLALRGTFQLPEPIDPFASTVSHAVAMSR